jgi:hypothetical protein
MTLRKATSRRRDMRDAIGSAMGSFLREASQNVPRDGYDEPDRRRRKSNGALSGVRGVVVGAGVATAAPFAAKGAGRFVKRAVVKRLTSPGSEATRELDEAQLNKAARRVKDAVSERFADAGGASGIAAGAAERLARIVLPRDQGDEQAGTPSDRELREDSPSRTVNEYRPSEDEDREESDVGRDDEAEAMAEGGQAAGSEVGERKESKVPIATEPVAEEPEAAEEESSSEEREESKAPVATEPVAEEPDEAEEEEPSSEAEKATKSQERPAPRQRGIRRRAPARRKAPARRTRTSRR